MSFKKQKKKKMDETKSHISIIGCKTVKMAWASVAVNKLHAINHAQAVHTCHNILHKMQLESKKKKKL